MVVVLGDAGGIDDHAFTIAIVVDNNNGRSLVNRSDVRAMMILKDLMLGIQNGRFEGLWTVSQTSMKYGCSACTVKIGRNEEVTSLSAFSRIHRHTL